MCSVNFLSMGSYIFVIGNAPFVLMARSGDLVSLLGIPVLLFLLCTVK